MSKPRIIIADTDINYIIPLQFKFVEEYFEKVNLELISDEIIFKKVFSVPQEADILIVSESLYDSSLRRHNIRKVFLMTEQEAEDSKSEQSVQVYKHKRYF